MNHLQKRQYRGVFTCPQVVSMCYRCRGNLAIHGSLIVGVLAQELTWTHTTNVGYDQVYGYVVGQYINFNFSHCEWNYRWTLTQNQKITYSSVLHSHTVCMKLCPIYRQLNSVLYCNNQVLKTLIFNKLVLKYF